MLSFYPLQTIMATTQSKDNVCTRPCNRMSEHKKCDFKGCSYWHSVFQARFIPCREKVTCKRHQKKNCPYYHEIETPSEYLSRRFDITEENSKWLYRHPFFNQDYYPIPGNSEEARILTLSVEQEYMKLLNLNQEEIENEMEEVLNEIDLQNEDDYKLSEHEDYDDDYEVYTNEMNITFSKECDAL